MLVWFFVHFPRSVLFRLVFCPAIFDFCRVLSISAEDGCPIKSKVGGYVQSFDAAFTVQKGQTFGHARFPGGLAGDVGYDQFIFSSTGDPFVDLLFQISEPVKIVLHFLNGIKSHQAQNRAIYFNSRCRSAHLPSLRMLKEARNIDSSRPPSGMPYFAGSLTSTASILSHSDLLNRPAILSSPWFPANCIV